MKTKPLLLISLLCLPLAGCNTLKEWLPLQDAERQAPNSAEPELSSADIYYRLGVRLASGNDGDPNYPRALDAFQKAADLGHVEAQYMLGTAYLNGKGTQPDTEQAVKWLEKSAQKGHAQAQYALGNIYLNGRGVSPEEAWGVHWLMRSAKQGHGPAQLATGVAFATGMGVVQDLGEASMWLRLAQSNNQPQAQALLNRLHTKMSADEIAQADARFNRWSPQRYTTVISPAEIRFVQHCLNLLGFPSGSIDGLLGPNTRKGIAAYTSDRGLSDIGNKLNTDLISAIRSEMGA
ncbi:SEL1-like repeat protein [Pontibacterium granulatum]|uniref:SEL1-like repeat protein n=1 Tax=Pontibacterium granulatum TaxID=2036029 RepID=UPI00249A0D1D|nr:SEL1-like repeat protein [Pontibacterium granulatum]MDI3324790.1 SEL1-like repeat protein [Pontibacterium granulatum]